MTEDACGGKAGGTHKIKKEGGGLDPRGMLVVTGCSPGLARDCTRNGTSPSRVPGTVWGGGLAMTTGAVVTGQQFGPLKLTREPEQELEMLGRRMEEGKSARKGPKVQAGAGARFLEINNARKCPRYGSSRGELCLRMHLRGRTT